MIASKKTNSKFGRCRGQNLSFEVWYLKSIDLGVKRQKRNTTGDNGREQETTETTRDHRGQFPRTDFGPRYGF